MTQPLARDVPDAPNDFLVDVLAGLGQPQKTLSCKFLYDDLGSRLFDAITALPEYYPTRTEIALLREIGPRLREVVGPSARIVELGSGAGTKVALLLDALDRVASYVPVELSHTALDEATRRLQAERPGLQIAPVLADYTRPFALPAAKEGAGRTLGFFPGSTIGNFAPAQASSFLAQMRRQLGPDSLFLVGVDRKKDRATLERAYDDPIGLTAAFNRNLLARINRELGAEFDLATFRHRAVWNETQGRIEMHLVSEIAQTVTVGNRSFDFAAGETIHTENSYKYGLGQFRQMADSAGWRPVAAWTDACDLFSLHLLQA